MAWRLMVDLSDGFKVYGSVCERTLVGCVSGQVMLGTQLRQLR